MEHSTPWRMDPWELAAREHVRDTLARYDHAGDAGRVEELAQQFTPDGQLLVDGEEPLIGRAAIAEHLSAEAQRNAAAAESAPGTAPPLVSHHVSSVLIHAVTPTEARAASYFLVLGRSGPTCWGRYRDRLVPHDGRWLIARREVRVDASGPIEDGLGSGG